MIVTETIPSVVTWAEIKQHCRLDTDDERTYLFDLVSRGVVEQVEREMHLALGERTVTIVYSRDDMERDLRPRYPLYGSGTYCGSYLNGSRLLNRASILDIPKGPVVSITSISNASETLAATDYELRKQGHNWYVHLNKVPSPPVTLVATIGHAIVPFFAKQGILILTDEYYRNRGATGNQQQYVNAFGFDRLVKLFDTQSALVG